MIQAVFPAPTSSGGTITGVCAAFGYRESVPATLYPVTRTAAAITALGRVRILLGIHLRRIEKLYNSTNLAPLGLAGYAYVLLYGDVHAAVKA